MPQLKNIQHEKFARALLTEPSQSQAYSKVYKTPDPVASRCNASRLISNENVKERVRELMSQKGLGLAPIVERLGHWVYDEDHAAVSLDAVKTGLKLHGVLDADQNITNPQDIAVSINIIGQVNLSSTSKPIDINEL